MRTKIAMLSVITLLWIFALPEAVNCKRILVIAYMPLHSHQSVFRSLWLALHKRGHELVLATLSHNATATLNNYTEIDFSYLKHMIDDTDFVAYHLSGTRRQMEKFTWNLQEILNKELFEHPQIRRLYAPESNEKFDLVIVEGTIGLAACSFAHRFHAPLIGIVTMDVLQYVRYLLGELLLPSYPSNWETNKNSGFNLPFWQKTANYLEMLHYIYRWTYIYMPQQQEVAQKYLGADAGNLHDTIRNMSLLFVERITTLTYAKPEPANIINFNSIHIAKEPPPLPKNLKHFLDGATEGFIYMSLGSTIKSSTLSQEKLSTIVKAFSKLPCKVLWKFEGENLPGKPDNVFITKWTPQQGVLAHSNIKAFISQGGSQSIDEAIHYAVPIIGIPIMYDQEYIVNRLVEKGVARRVNLDNLSETDLVTAIRDVLNDKRYKKNMISLNELTKDKPVDDIENLVWWIEYVMRHDGAPHLRYKGAYEPFYERYDMNIIAFLAVALFTITMLLLFVLTKCLCFIVRSRVLVGTIYKTAVRQASVKEKTS